MQRIIPAGYPRAVGSSWKTARPMPQSVQPQTSSKKHSGLCLACTAPLRTLPSPSCKRNTTLKRPLRWKNCTYCPGQSELCWGPQLQEKTELASPFGLWEIPGHKVEVVPQTVIDQASLAESLPAHWQERLLLPGLWELKEQTFPLQRENSSLSLFPGLRGEHRAFQQRGAGLCSHL